MDKMRPDELDDRLENGNPPFLLDIRPTQAFRTDAIEGSTNVPVYDELARGDESSFRSRLDELPADREIAVVCKMGVVAKRATRILNEEGYDAVTLAGGMSGWNGYRRGSIGYKLRSAVWRFTG